MHMGNIFEFLFLLWKQPHQRPLRLECEAAPTGNESLRSSSCSINHPIFHEGTKVNASPQILITLLLCPYPFSSLTPP